MQFSSKTLVFSDVKMSQTFEEYLFQRSNCPHIDFRKKSYVAAAVLWPNPLFEWRWPNQQRNAKHPQQPCQFNVYDTSTNIH